MSELGDSAGQEPGIDDSHTQAGKKEGDDPEAQDPKTAQGKVFSQEEVDDLIKRRLEREKAKSVKAAESAAKAAELKTLADKQEWQSLAEKRQDVIMTLESRVGELEAIEEQATQYEKLLTSYRDQLMDGVPENIQILLKKMDLVSQFDWLKSYKPETQPPPPGPPATPGRVDAVKLGEKEKAQRAFSVRF